MKITESIGVDQFWISAAELKFEDEKQRQTSVCPLQIYCIVDRLNLILDVYFY